MRSNNPSSVLYLPEGIKLVREYDRILISRHKEIELSRSGNHSRYQARENLYAENRRNNRISYFVRENDNLQIREIDPDKSISLTQI